MTGSSQSPFFQKLSEAAAAVGNFVRKHEPEIRALAVWGTVSTACREARLYAPMHLEAWTEIASAARVGRDGDPPDYEAIVIAAYGRGGVGFGALKQELLGAPLLQARTREVGEVLDSLADGRNYVTVCGALPLIEYVLSNAVGKWNQPLWHLELLKRRLNENDLQDANLILDFAAVEMVLDEIPTVWKSGRHEVGAVAEDLNRHLALHGTGLGWDDPTNAARAVLLLGAAARVAETVLNQGRRTLAAAPPTTR